ncbi:MAG: hypothetical protein BAA01_04660 [Bacillus thermozeamaize]|jgi:membrane protein YqaA with SNARE-associated domain|uniref:VTT domain-containing protein n=1 Tax=Bacillus thermozeamaize TaxID=230954 RepID=A0A1Y3PDU1_9BACI|nr:MAG: hypothetical protein BAA01_04660 [Bacillus thermozeamaize]
MNFGAWGLFIHAFIDAIIFPIPAFFLQVSLSLINPSSALWLATVGYIGCLLGTPFGYLIGKFLGNSLLYKLLKKQWIESASAMFQRNGELAILVGSFTPIPFKVFTILAGCLKFSLWRLIGYAAIGRAAKFYVVGALFFVYGKAAEAMVNEYLNYLFLGVALLLTFVILFKKRMQKNRQEQKEQTEEI